jgi:hypothetical protein
MSLTRSCTLALLTVLPLVSIGIASPLPAAHTTSKSALLRADQATAKRLLQLQREGFTSIALALSDTNPAVDTLAARRVSRAGLELDYWIEIARNPALADAHPEWMASIQTHQEWRRLFPQFAKAQSNSVVKVYPWVPVLYRETVGPHVQRVAQLLRDRPAPRRLFLNDLQGAPSACGCGHPLCRWTTDYGPLKSASRLPNEAAAQFVEGIKRIQPELEVIPVWTTECEEHDRQGMCGGVGCFHGTCWREWSAQLTPLAVRTDTIGVLLLYRAFQRDLPIYGAPAGWITSALGFFQQMPLRYQASGIPTHRLLAILQGWDVTAEQIQAEVSRASEAGTAGVLVVFTPIDQSWTPKMLTLSATQ